MRKTKYLVELVSGGVKRPVCIFDTLADATKTVKVFSTAKSQVSVKMIYEYDNFEILEEYVKALTSTIH